MAQIDSLTLYKRLMKYVMPHWKIFMVSVFCIAVVAMTEPALPALMKPMLDTGFVAKDQSFIRLIPFLIVLLFLGGWTMPGWVPAAATSFPLAGIFWFMLKVYIVFTVFVWIRASLPRVRTDQLLRVGWNRMVPLALLSVVLAALLVTVKCLPVLGCIPTLGG